MASSSFRPEVFGDGFFDKEGGAAMPGETRQETTKVDLNSFFDNLLDEHGASGKSGSEISGVRAADSSMSSDEGVIRESGSSSTAGGEKQTRGQEAASDFVKLMSSGSEKGPVGTGKGRSSGQGSSRAMHAAKGSIDEVSGFTTWESRHVRDAARDWMTATMGAKSGSSSAMPPQLTSPRVSSHAAMPSSKGSEQSSNPAISP